MEEVHRCDKDLEIKQIIKDIGEVKKICISLDKSLRGNGKAGLFTEFAVLKVVVTGVLALNIMIIGSMIALWIGV